MLRPSRDFGKREKRRCAASSASRRFPASWGRAKRELPSRPQFQALQPGCDVEADLTLQAERLQRDRIGRTTDQNVAAAAHADRRAAWRTSIVAGKITRPEPRHRRIYAPGERGFLG